MCTPSVKFITNQTFFTPVGAHSLRIEGEWGGDGPLALAGLKLLSVESAHT